MVAKIILHEVALPSACRRLQRRIAEMAKKARGVPREDIEERERLIQAYRDEMVDQMPSEDYAPPEAAAPGPFDPVDLDELPPHDSSLDESPPQRAARPKRPPPMLDLGSEPVREFSDRIVRPDEYASFK